MQRVSMSEARINAIVSGEMGMEQYVVRSRDILCQLFCRREEVRGRGGC
jgi:hypothetical protein